MPQLSIVNRSGEAISCHQDGHHAGGDIERILPSTTVIIQVPSLRLNLTLSPYISSEKEKSTPVHDSWSSGLNGVVIGHSFTFGATWAVLKASEGSPWIIYRSKVFAILIFASYRMLIVLYKDYQGPSSSAHSTS